MAATAAIITMLGGAIEIIKCITISSIIPEVWYFCPENNAIVTKGAHYNTDRN